MIPAICMVNCEKDLSVIFSTYKWLHITLLIRGDSFLILLAWKILVGQFESRDFGMGQSLR